MLTTLLSTALLPAVLSFSPAELWRDWPEERFVTTPAPCLRPAELEDELHELVRRHEEQGRDWGLDLKEAGRSVQDRPIYLLTLGRGPKKILLWSQMHGDEPSATPALLDLAHYLLRHRDEPSARAILQETTLLLVPMLNPDGAEVYRRRNAQAIDINRDALNLATPEGRLLKRLRDEHEPLLGFNLHDQNRRTAVGDSGVLASNAVLAVAGDEAGTLTPGRLRARRACAAIVRALAPFVPGGMARYDEDWSPRAFGDNLTAWGTPVVLIESGAVPPGGSFEDLTRLNFVALLRTLSELVENDLEDHDPQIYEDLLRNESDAWADVVVRGGFVLQPGTTEPYRADLALNLPRDDREEAGCVARGPRPAYLVEVGDARFLGGSRNLPAADSLVIAPFVVGVRGWKARRWLDGKALDGLARAGIGTVRWQVPARRREAARDHARRLAKPGRPDLEPVDASSAPPLLGLSGPAAPPAGAGASLDALLGGVVGESWWKLREGRPLWQALQELEAERREEAAEPTIRRGRPPSFLLLSPFHAEEPVDGTPDLEGAELRAIWIRGVEVEAP